MSSQTRNTANLARDEADHRSAHITITSYDVVLDLSGAPDQSQETYPSTSTVVFHTNVESTFLDFIAPRVRRVTVNGRELDPAQVFDGNRVQVDGLVSGHENTVVVEGDAAYSRSGEGMHRFVDAVDGETYLYTQYEPADCRRVFANFEQPDLKASFTFHITAPDGWEVLSNQSEVSREPAGEGATTHHFAPTLPISTYITCVCAGPYHRVDGSWSRTFEDGQTLEIPLAVLCRKTLAEHFDAERLLETHRKGLDYFHDNYDYPYPWGKYESIFVPEYNLGAMENPGLVTFTESYIFRSRATAAQYSGRDNTILHEMCHMWFGDLVTMQWWNDLWLKESFAEYMGTAANTAVGATDSWSGFAVGRKSWAYMQDQLPTTHPIVATIDDVEAAKQNFDGITYAKGASVLKQLVAYVGEDAFFEGARRYFKAHEFGNTTLPDLLTQLTAASGRDLTEWVRLWLQTSGPSTLTPVLEDKDGVIERLTITQEAVDPTTGEQVLRPHRLAVGLYRLDGDVLKRAERIELDVAGESTVVEEAAGLPVPELVLVNDDDLTYAKVRLDERSLATAREHLGKIDDELARATIWGALWNATRDGLLPADDFIETVLAQAATEKVAAIQRTTTGQLAMALGFLPADRRPALRRRLVDEAWRLLGEAEPGSDAQVIWSRTFATFAAQDDSRRADVEALLAGTATVEGLTVDPELRWALQRALAATGHADTAELDAELERDPSNLGIASRMAALAARPTEAAKAEAWAQATEDTSLSNDQLRAVISGFEEAGQGHLVAPYASRYWESLEQWWAGRSIVMASILVNGLFPFADLEEGQEPETHPAVQDATTWLEQHESAPAALRRSIMEGRDHLLRRLRGQAAHRG